MCTPPYCSPAHHCIGCLSLKHGATLVLVADALYGVVLVTVHALLLGEMDEESVLALISTTLAPSSARSAAKRHHWFWQVLDLDLVTGHRLLGFSDYACLLFGLLYGIAILVVCGYVLNALLHHRDGDGLSSFHSATKWFVAFLHIQLMMYFALSLVKFHAICKNQMEFYPTLAERCEVLQYQYLEQSFVRLLLGSLCCWVFASYSHFLNQYGTSPELEEPAFDRFVSRGMSSLGNSARLMSPFPVIGPAIAAPNAAPCNTSHTRSLSYAPQTRAQSFVGSAPGSFHAASTYVMRGMPRANSSMVASTTDSETQGLILKGSVRGGGNMRGPVGVH